MGKMISPQNIATGDPMGRGSAASPITGFGQSGHDRRSLLTMTASTFFAASAILASANGRASRVEDQP